MDILLAFFDLIPVFLFLFGIIIYQRLFYNKMSKGAFAIYATGGIVIFVAGLLKAIHKILFYLNICDFTRLQDAFFPMQTVGYVLLGAAMIAVLFFNQKEKTNQDRLNSLALLPILAAPAVYNGTMLFVILMVLGVIIHDVSLIIYATRVKNNKVLIIILITASLLLTLGMGYLSTKEGFSDWVKEIINTVAQGAFFVSALLLKKSELASEDFNLKLINKR